MSVHLDAITLDDRVRKYPVGDFRRELTRLRGFPSGEVELEILALPHVLDRAVAERLERVGNRPSLRVEHGRFQRDEHSRAHAATPSPERVEKRDRKYGPRASAARRDRTPSRS